MMSLEERLAIPITPAPALYILLPTGYMPDNYFADVPAPQIGMHWSDMSFAPGVPQSENISTKIYDLTGRLVKTLGGKMFEQA